MKEEEEFRFKELKGVFPTEEEFVRVLRGVITVHLPREKWVPDKVVEYIRGCRMSGGIPMFKTGYAGQEFREDSKPASMAVCWGGTNGGSKMFTDIPEDIFSEMKAKVGDWKWLLSKYAPAEVEKLKGIPVKIY